MEMWDQEDVLYAAEGYLDEWLQNYIQSEETSENNALMKMMSELSALNDPKSVHKKPAAKSDTKSDDKPATKVDIKTDDKKDDAKAKESDKTKELHDSTDGLKKELH